MTELYTYQEEPRPKNAPLSTFVEPGALVMQWVKSPVKVIDQASGEVWQLYNGDSAEVLKGLPTASVGLSVESLPFSNVYSYSPSDRDLGNTRDALEFFRQFRYINRERLRVMMPGRIVAIHCKNLPLYGTRDGVTGRWDFRGAIIRHMQKLGYIYHSEVTIDKDPTIPAKAYHPQNLLYVTLEKDSSKSGSCEADYVCFFRTPGENPVPIKNDLTRPEWVKFAHPVWSNADIREIDVLDPGKNMTNEDERHLCPLQLPVIERCVRLYSNPGEVVLDPFNGVGSTGFVAIQKNRKYIGIELSSKYFKASVANLQEAERLAGQKDLWQNAGIEVEVAS
jgi:DNA modification methylase